MVESYSGRSPEDRGELGSGLDIDNLRPLKEKIKDWVQNSGEQTAMAVYFSLIAGTGLASSSFLGVDPMGSLIVTYLGMETASFAMLECKKFEAECAKYSF